MTAAYFADYGEDLHAYGSLAPIVDGFIGWIVIQPDGSRYVARAVPDPLAQPVSDGSSRREILRGRCRRRTWRSCGEHSMPSTGET